MMIESDLVDVRSLPIWERPGVVLDVFDRLPVGGSLTVVTDAEPRGLTSRIEQGRRNQLMVDPRRISECEWTIQIVRSAATPEAPSVALAVARAPVFYGLSHAMLERLTAEATVQTVRRGHTVVPEKSEWPYLGVVIEGVLAFSSGTVHSRARIFGEVFPSEIFGELELFDGAPAAARVFALSKHVRYMRIPRETIFELSEMHPELLRAIGRVGAQRSRELMQTLATQGTMPIIARIAQALLPFATPERGLAHALAPLPTMTQAQIAATAGTVKEVAARAIAELEQREMLKRERGHIRFLDRQKLLDLVKGGE
jgi:CRP/FNR family transcriptional regulator